MGPGQGQAQTRTKARARSKPKAKLREGGEWGEDDIMFKCTKIFHLFHKKVENDGVIFYSLASPLISNLY